MARQSETPGHAYSLGNAVNALIILTTTKLMMMIIVVMVVVVLLLLLLLLLLMMMMMMTMTMVMARVYALCREARRNKRVAFCCCFVVFGREVNDNGESLDTLDKLMHTKRLDSFF